MGLTHPFTSEHPVRPFANNIHNVVSALKERVFFVDDVGTERPEWRAESVAFFAYTEQIARLVAPAQVSWEHFVSTRPGSKRKLYEDALVRLKEENYSLLKLAETNLFTKFERTWWIKPQVPRIINPRDPRYHILLGSYLLAVEKPIYNALQTLVNQEVPCVAKGYTQEEKAQHIKNLLTPGWMCVGLDASRFDQCIGDVALSIEHSVYTGIYRNNRLLAELLRLQRHNVGRYRSQDGTVVADMGAIRCSGDMNTSLGNCIISVLLAHEYCQQKGIAHKVYCDGDDLLLFVKRGQDLSDLPQWYLERGFRMKVEPPAYNLEDVEFCQSRIVWCTDRYVLVRNPVKCLTTDYTGYIECLSDKVWQQIMHSTGSCGLSLFYGCPILQEWYEWGLRHGVNHGKKLNRGMGVADFYLRAKTQGKKKAIPISDEARASFCAAYGITPCQQIAVEQSIRGMVCGAGYMPNKESFASTLNTLIARSSC